MFGDTPSDGVSNGSSPMINISGAVTLVRGNTAGSDAVRLWAQLHRG
jgi:hypothetical protein